jgi:DNA-binding beta-propeller fold protein YncE
MLGSHRCRLAATAALGALALGLWSVPGEWIAGTEVTAATTPHYVVDPYWPKPLPDNMLIGQVAGIAVDQHDLVWIIQRPGSLTDDERGAALDPPRSICCHPAPPVMVFDRDGNYVMGWGGLGEGYDWPINEHGIFVDHNDNVWIAGNHADDHQVLKFSRDGTFLMQIGRPGETGGSNDTELLGRPADTEVDPVTNEVYIADGYLNRRVIVYDAETGEYKRHWGAYGRPPVDGDLEAYDPDADPEDTFRNPVHCVRIADDGLVYVCDRAANRIQVFQKDGTFVTEWRYNPRTLGPGSVWDLDLSRDEAQTWLHNADGSNNQVQHILRETGELVGSFGRNGRYAGEFHWVHNLALDSEGNIYTAEVDTGKRTQKFRPVHR